MQMSPAVQDFIEAASVPRDAWHASGDLSKANEILKAHPEVALADIFVASVLGETAAIEEFLRADPDAATRKGGPRDWDPLTYLCFSRYLKLDRARSPGFLQSAKLLLEAGADAKTGWFEKDHEPQPEWESVLYGVSGIAHNPDLTQLLLDHGADPNDGETVYHTPETFDNRALKVLVGSGKLTDESLALMLIRKHDWHDYDGAKWLLEHGANPNHVWGNITPLIQAIRRDNDAEVIEIVLAHGADPLYPCHGINAIQLAARRGRADLLQLFERQGFVLKHNALDALLIACACNDVGAAHAALIETPSVLDELRENGGAYLSQFAGNGNDHGVRLLLEVGLDPNAPYKEGDGYFAIAPDARALHVACWRIRPSATKVLLELGADPNIKDSRGRTPLMFSLKGCTESYWKERRTPECVDLLLKAGATLEGIDRLSGYEDADKLLLSAGLKP